MGARFQAYYRLFGAALSMVVVSACSPPAQKSAPKPVQVTVVHPEQRKVTAYEDLPGRVEPMEEVKVEARVTGYLNKVCFMEGSEVKKGDLLYSIDPRQYQAEYDVAVANVAIAQAQLAQAQSDYERTKTLSGQKVISAQENEKQATAVRAAEASVRSAQATVDKTRLNLEFTQITSPIDGKISRTNVTEGNLIQNGDQLTTIVRQRPVYVTFEAPERAVLRWDKAKKDATAGGITAQARAYVGLLNETDFPREGKLGFIDNELNPGTGTLRMRAELPNEDGRLRVGLYARVRLTLDDPMPALLVPERAVGIDQGARFVYIVTPDNKIEYRKVVVGQLYGGMRAITEGLKPDDRVVTEGLISLIPGQTVQPIEAPDNKTSESQLSPATAGAS